MKIIIKGIDIEHWSDENKFGQVKIAIEADGLTLAAISALALLLNEKAVEAIQEFGVSEL